MRMWDRERWWRLFWTEIPKWLVRLDYGLLIVLGIAFIGAVIYVAWRSIIGPPF
jgi:hypothetical protein